MKNLSEVVCLNFQIVPDVEITTKKNGKKSRKNHCNKVSAIAHLRSIPSMGSLKYCNSRASL